LKEEANMFKQLSDKIDYASHESEILEFWEKENIFKQSIDSREGRPAFTFYEGPPTANGRPGIHHVMARTLKDIVCRYKTMRGFQVHRKAGWDTHGLPVEIEVEKSLGFKFKDEIVSYGIAKFNQACKESVWKYKADWERMTKMMGYWVDLDHPYVTFENEYMESIWWALKQYYDQKMIYKGYKIQPYCPHCETPLSSHEVSLGYQDVKEPSIYVTMKVKGEENTYFLVWTTTPWTLISNVALAVHPDVDYVTIENEGRKLILAESRLGVIAGEYTILDRVKGEALAGKEYERLYSYHEVPQKGWYVVEADFVTTEDGSGIVHIAPAYGEDDYQVGLKYGLPTIHPVNKSGRFNSEVTDFADTFVKQADPEIIAELKHRHLLYKKEMYQHSYPHCWRCTSPLLYYARDSWYIRTTSYASKMVELNNQINWIPSEVGSGRFGNWLAENKDWALSRDRFWGTPLPIWICPDCKAEKCIGSIAELKEGKNLPEPLDLHKPFVDGITFSCSCGGTMKRTSELIDVWFDSGAMPFAQWHYPFENKEIFERSYPADFISEGIDQTRGWFYTLHSIGVFLFNKPAFKNCLVNELILDKDGQKMSKSRGNTVDPFALMQKYGADTSRWYLIASSPVWRPTLFNEESVGDMQRKFFSTLLNTYAFFTLYANVDNFTYKEDRIPNNERPEIDRWILSELQTLVQNYMMWMDEYDLTHAARAISDFAMDLLSNWYVRRNRRRFWKSEHGKDKLAAYQTLYECLITIVEMIAPFAPFLAERLYQNLNSVTMLNQEASVHLVTLHAPDKSAIDVELEERMEMALRIVGIVRAMRMKSNLKVRQPLHKIIIPIHHERMKSEIEQMTDVILDEINVKRIEFVTDESGIVKKKAKANFKMIGPKFGKAAQKIGAAIKELPAAAIKELETSGTYNLLVDGISYSISREDIEILHEDVQGWLVETQGDMMVALDTTLDEELIEEGLTREFINRVQNLRKESGLEVTDRIKIYYHSSSKISHALERMKSFVQQETLAAVLVQVDTLPVTGLRSVKEEIDGEAVEATIEKAGYYSPEKS
jgi:isoleucyl-tRNA synthetase